MLRAAFFISVAFHLAVLLSIRNLVLLSEPATRQASRTQTISAQLISRLGENASVPPSGQLPAPLPRDKASSSDPMTKPAGEARHPVSGAFSPSTATDHVAVTERASARAGDLAVIPSASPRESEGVSPDGVRQYRLNLAREARRFKHFPALARERGWEGVVVVVVSTVAGAPLPQVSLTQSSGFELLDQEALALVAQAVNTAVLPDSLRNRTFALTLPIHYRLDD